jgi:hypothetical protein
MTDWQEVVMPESQPFLPSDDPIVQALGQSGERFLPPVDVVDWWEHSDPEARLSPSGIAGAQRQLIITTARVIVMKDGSLERSFPIRWMAGTKVPRRPFWSNRRVVGKSKYSGCGLWHLSRHTTS